MKTVDIQQLGSVCGGAPRTTPGSDPLEVVCEGRKFMPELYGLTFQSVNCKDWAAKERAKRAAKQAPPAAP